MKVLIIEDEILTAKDLARTILIIDPDIEIMDTIQTVEDTINYLRNNPEPDLIFSDIQLGNQLSFDIFKKLKTNVPVIFFTAYNKYAIEAFKANGIDYILKPFTTDTISSALEKFQSLKEKFGKTKDEISSILQNFEDNITKKNKAILVYIADKIIPIQISNIAVFYIENEITYAHTFESKQYIIYDKLDDLEKSNIYEYFRANRQILINRKAIKDVSNYFNRKLLINLTFAFKKQIIISKLRTSDFLRWLAKY